MKAINNLEKMLEKMEHFTPKFFNNENGREFESLKEDVIGIFEEMIQILHDDTDEEEEYQEEDGG